MNSNEKFDEGLFDDLTRVYNKWDSMQQGLFLRLLTIKKQKVKSDRI